MAVDVSQQIDKTLTVIVNFTDKTGNMKKELNKLIHGAVINLRNLIFILKSNLQEKTEENNKTRYEFKQLKDAFENWKTTSSARRVAPSVTSNTGITNRGTAVSAPPSSDKNNLFEEIVYGRNEGRHKITVKPNNNPVDRRNQEPVKTNSIP
jgi:hypothetical protein